MRQQKVKLGKCPPEMHISSPFVSSHLTLFPSSRVVFYILFWTLARYWIIPIERNQRNIISTHVGMCAQRLGSWSAIAHLDVCVIMSVRVCVYMCVCVCVCVCVVLVLARLLSLSLIRWGEVHGWVELIVWQWFTSACVCGCANGIWAISGKDSLRGQLE